jgi:hypothetical protein
VDEVYDAGSAWELADSAFGVGWGFYTIVDGSLARIEAASVEFVATPNCVDEYSEMPTDEGGGA